ncbi:baculoviral IAP repeat-containing protein 7-B-like [Watersipora subatra]|uniref:baculoviral IAP repeat-containing protein 7-B-like n=1 Tax=Watersipora subatra TaxID=2589382 RepID=UPI00355B6536
MSERATRFQEVLSPPNLNHLAPKQPVNITIYTVATYSASYNRYLPNLLLRKLTQMSPNKFLKFIYQALTSMQLDELMLDEKQRRKTFMANWPYSGGDSTLTGDRMAKAGFYNLNRGDRVCCAFCKGCLFDWKEGEVVMTEHARQFNFCKFVKGFECGNRLYHIRSEASDSRCGNIEMDGTTVYPQAKAIMGTKANFECLGIVDNSLHNKRKAPSDSRLNSFKHWPDSNPVSATSLTEAGFYFTGCNDEVQCFSCGGILKDWQTNDCPWREHAKWFPHCSFLVETKGESFVAEVGKSYGRELLHFSKRPKSYEDMVSDSKAAMTQICLSLGHCQETFDKAFASNKEPFNNMLDLIDVIYKIEEGELDVEIQQEECSNEITVSDSSEFLLSCRECCKSNVIAEAKHLALPCGHLAFCENCASKAKEQAESQAVLCPFPDCGCELLGSQKVYFT